MRLTLSIATISLLGACASPTPMPVPYSQAMLPDAVKVSAANPIAIEAAAVGDITYQCRAKKDSTGQFEWVFAGPSAVLRDRQGAVIGKYYGPPATWESVDGSKVTGTQLAVAPNGDGNIPLQLVKANPASGSGAMQGISLIQRVATKGGIAPKLSCTKANEGDNQTVPYKADYIFYRAV